MPERARTDLWEPQGSNSLGPPGPDRNRQPGNASRWIKRRPHAPGAKCDSNPTNLATRGRPLSMVFGSHHH